jgi:microcystin-dependent protein
MSEPFLSEIKIVSFNFPPKGWAFCNGQLLPINQNQALFALLGTTYGGNGQTTFALPDLRGRVPIHFQGQFTLGEAGGEEFHTLSMSEMTAHIHFMEGTSSTGDTPAPTGNLLADSPAQLYSTTISNQTTLLPQSVTNIGGSQAHENRQPFLVLNFIIALQGIFPSRN